MATLLATQETTESNAVDYAKAFSMAKQALAYISTFQSPPTPEIYEVWYRFVEGENTAIQDQLSHAVNIAKTVTTKQLHELRKQFLTSSESSKANLDISQKLTREMDGLQSLIATQQGANVEFGGSIASANTRLQQDSVSPTEFKDCLSQMLEGNEKMTQKMAEMDAKLQSSKNQIFNLRQTLAELQKEMLTDPLTGVGNRRLFDTTMMRLIESKPEDKCHYLYLLDLDKFKAINDTHGHTTGDDALRFVATALRKLTVDATISRYGGDEFAIFVQVDEPDQAREIAESICQFFFEEDLIVKLTGEQFVKLTVSVGAAILRSDDSCDSWFERADKLLYSAKFGGRNRAMVERKRPE